MANICIALAGNPNCGKTTMFNDLTGSAQYVGNWAGVTVEKKSGICKKYGVEIIDLPGVYSLSSFTPEEKVTKDYLEKEKPVVINVVDSSNLERNLYLTLQLAELGLPMCVALNMYDIVKERGDKINIEKLAEELGVPVIICIASQGTGSFDAVQCALTANSIDEGLPGKHLACAGCGGCEYGRHQQEIFGHAHVVEQTKRKITSTSTPEERYALIHKIVEKCYIKSHDKSVSATEKIDKVMTNRWLALPIFLLIMFLVYYISVTTVGTIATDWTNDVLFGEIITNWAEGLLVNSPVWLSSLVIDGIIGGVGSVLGFLPQMFVLFLLLCLLEDCGYMSRAAFIMDKIFSKFGLSGKSFIPYIISTGCGVPAIMASRTIENESERRLTIMTATFVPCGAKIPVIAMTAGLLGGAAWLAPTAYLVGIVSVFVSGLILKNLGVFKKNNSPFILELPDYHRPTFKGIMLHVWDRLKDFIIRAGTIIFIACVVIWFLSNFGFENGKFHMVSEDVSLLATLGGFIAPIFAPIGWGHWQTAVASLTGIVAKENIVSTMTVLNADSLLVGAAALSFMLFNLLCVPCFAAVGAIKREMNSHKWTFFTILYQCAFAYLIAAVGYGIFKLL